ncbi:putative transport protein [Cryptosporidium canis]|uniref:Transport protein n=1 Tax=Cryptosporidium canis TaxID=195482 RepID=A0ABQ8P4Q5_9CRYT|nr:putative transport protein [Cryptosporidium canis]KAJ1608201.1 putative transport protein [Cryptosporidium canis]
MIFQFFGDKKYAIWAYLGWLLILMLAIFECFFDTHSAFLVQYYANCMQSLLNPTPGAYKATASDFYEFIYGFLWIELAGVSLCNACRAILGNFIAFKWRTALNNYYLEKWECLKTIEGASQRIQEDCQKFAVILETIAIEMLYWSCKTLAFYRLVVNYGRSLSYVPFFGSHSHSLLFAALSFDVICFIPLLISGIKLPSIEYDNQVLEASYRKKLIYSEGVSVADEDLLTIRKLFIDVRNNSFQMYKHMMFVDSASTATIFFRRYFVGFFIIPSYFKGDIDFGTYTAAVTVLNNMLRILSYIRQEWSNLIELLSIKQRLDGFEVYLREHSEEQSLVEQRE